ncbi:hypothetical protein AALA98_10435 [Lachnospiraceae bacterium 45-W7]
MGTVQLGLMAEKLRGIAGLLEAASSCEDKITNQQFVCSYLSSELSGMADELEYGIFPKSNGEPDANTRQQARKREL